MEEAKTLFKNDRGLRNCVGLCLSCGGGGMNFVEETKVQNNDIEEGMESFQNIEKRSRKCTLSGI